MNCPRCNQPIQGEVPDFCPFCRTTLPQGPDPLGPAILITLAALLTGLGIYLLTYLLT